MANLCDTSYTFTARTGSEGMGKLWDVLTELEVDCGFGVWLSDFAARFGIDVMKENLYARGSILCCEQIMDEEDGQQRIVLSVESAWRGCHELFRSVLKVLDDDISMGYMEIEPGVGMYRVYNEESIDYDFRYYVQSSWGEDVACGDIVDVIREWEKNTGIPVDRKLTEEEMVRFMNEHEFESIDDHFLVSEFTEGM